MIYDEVNKHKKRLIVGLVLSNLQLSSKTSIFLLTNYSQPCFRLMIVLSGRGARNRTMIYGFGDRYTNHCTTPLGFFIITYFSST